MAIRVFAALGLASLVLCACAPGASDLPQAPSDPGACWRMGALAGAKTKFALVAVNDTGMENCAVHLEAVRLREGAGDLTGVFEGRFIFVTAADITVAKTYDSVRLPVFDAAHRQEVDADLKILLQREADAAKAKAGAAKHPAP